ncbi:DNA adenine methylase, partial [Culicoidibacter larvae]
MIDSTLKWIGGKSRSRDIYTNIFPEHKVFVSPFCGACHVELYKKPAAVEIINDVNHQLITFLSELQQHPKELIAACDAIPYSEKIYNDFKWNPPQDISPLKQAAIFYFMTTAGFNGGGNKYKSGFSVSKTVNKSKLYRSKLSNMKLMADRIKDWQILCRDFEEVIKKFDSVDTLFFCDPPYIDKEYLYSGGFTYDDHRRLADVLNNVKGKVVLCYYDDPLLAELYPDWHQFDYSTKSYMRSKDECTDKTEIILTNYEVQMQL